MHLPTIKVIPKKTEQQTMGFKGLNRMPVTDSGELTAMVNMSVKNSPILCPRGSRELVQTLTNGTALFSANGKICWIDGSNFVFDGVVKGTVTVGPKSIAEYFGIILIFPDKKYYNYVTGVFGTMSAPDIKYVCVFNNRAYGVGGNGFYASKLGDPLTWNQFSIPILSEDSWQTNTGEEGEFSGIKVSQNHVMATKAGHLYELYGTKPSDFKLQKIVDVGCIDAKSIVEIDGILYFLSDRGFRAYAGSIPKPISTKLNEVYKCGAAGTDGRLYYASLYNGTEYKLYIYDTYNDLWCKEDGLQVADFLRMNDNFYALAGNKIYKFNSGRETIEWEFETENFTEWYMGKKVNKEIKIMAEMSPGSSINIYCSIDDRGFSLQESISSAGFLIRDIFIKQERANRFKVRIKGIGEVKVFGFAREMIIGSTV